MNTASGTKAPHRLSRPAAGLGLIALLMAGCAQIGGQPAPAPVEPMAAALRPMDAVTAFASTATPGAEAAVTLSSGRNARVRLLRAYNAASGRECREVLIGGGLNEGSRLVCRVDGQWADARPLLRGGGSMRP